MSFENYNFGDGGPESDYYYPQPYPFGDTLPHGVDPREQADMLDRMQLEDVLWRKMQDDRAAAAYQQAQQAQPVVHTWPTPEKLHSPEPESERGRDGGRPPIHEPYRYDIQSPQPPVVPEGDIPTVEPHQGSYGKAIAMVATVGSLVLGGIFMANQEDAPQASTHTSETSQELAYDCQVTGAKEINENTAVVTFAKPVNTDHYNIEIGSINDQKELDSHITPGPVSASDSPSSFAFTVNGFEDQRLVAQVTDNHGNSTFCDGAFGVSQNPGDTWVDPSQNN